MRDEYQSEDLKRITTEEEIHLFSALIFEKFKKFCPQPHSPFSGSAPHRLDRVLYISSPLPHPYFFLYTRKQLPMFYSYFRAACSVSSTSSAILASAMSCSLPPPLATFCSSAIWFRTASALKSSSGKPSTALMERREPGCTTAKPPDTVEKEKTN